MRLSLQIHCFYCGWSRLRWPGSCPSRSSWLSLTMGKLTGSRHRSVWSRACMLDTCLFEVSLETWKNNRCTSGDDTVLIQRAECFVQFHFCYLTSKHFFLHQLLSCHHWLSRCSVYFVDRMTRGKWRIRNRAASSTSCWPCLAVGNIVRFYFMNVRRSRPCVF